MGAAKVSPALIFAGGEPYLSAMATDRSYDYAARYYDAVYETASAARKDAAFYESLAVETGGPVLELGCGTGRVLLPIAAHGLECAGLDASAAMIAQCRAKPGGAALTLAEGRMEAFDFGPRKFALILAAFRVFQHLDTVEQQLACLARVRAHLAPGGAFAFDVFNPIPDYMVRETEPELLGETFLHEGRETKRYISMTRDRFRQLVHVAMRYVESREAGPPLETVVRFTMRWFWRYELEHLLYRAGFSEVTFYGDFDRSPLSPASPAFVVVAR